MKLSNNLIYADYNANVPLRECAKAAMNAVYDIFGNPSSIHKNGQKLTAIIENARQNVSAALGNISGQLIFTSGATEAAQLAIESAALMGFDRVFLGAIEHDCVFQFAKDKFKNLEIIPINQNGIYDIDWISGKINEGEKPLILMMAVNNETGIIQPIKAAANLAHSHGGAIVVDAVQALGKIDCTEFATYCDYLFVSGHKIGAPIGVGALIYAPGIEPFLGRPGGGQEKGMRAGTINVAAIAAMGTICENIDTILEENTKIQEISDAFENGLTSNFNNVQIIGKTSPRVSNTICFAIAPLKAEHLVIFLDLEGIALSSGSACSSGSAKVSRALAALNLKENQDGFIRVSFGYKSELSDVNAILTALKKAHDAQSRRAA